METQAVPASQVTSRPVARWEMEPDRHGVVRPVMRWSLVTVDEALDRLIATSSAA